MEYIKLTNEGERKLKSMSLGLKYMVKYLMNGLNDIFGGGCSEEQLACTVGNLKNNAEGKVSDDDVVNYDQAGKMLGFGTTNRVGLKKLLDKNGIKQVVINNQKVGFLKSEISALHDKMDKHIK